MSFERVLRWLLAIVAVVGLLGGILAHVLGQQQFAQLCWAAATIPVIAGLAASMTGVMHSA
jgi:hypothetical protein